MNHYANKGSVNILLASGLVAFILLILTATGMLPFSTSVSLAIRPEGARIIRVGDTFTAYVEIDSEKVINTIVADLRYPADKMEVVALSDEESIINMWAKEPQYSNASGTVTFGGGIIRGFDGDDGRVLAITFKAKISGDAGVEFASATVFAADGKGTEVLDDMVGITYLIQPEDSVLPDFNHDNTVGLGDLSILLSHFGSNNAAYDLDRDGKVGFGDLKMMLSLII